MPVIKARTRGKHFVRHITRLDRENQETLHAYATFLNEPPDYVMNQVIDTLLARDKEFQSVARAASRAARAATHGPEGACPAPRHGEPGVVSSRTASAGAAAPSARVG